MTVPYKRTRDVYWAAGLFEGEGCISFTKTGRGRVSLEMTDRDVVERFASVVGIGKVTGPRARQNPDYKPLYAWVIYSRRDCESFLRLLYPLLCERRQSQADRLLSLHHSRRPVHRLVLGERCRNGHLLTEETLYINPKRGYKHCKPCRKAEHPPSPGRVRGARVGTSKLTEDDVRAIMRSAGKVSRKDLADRFGVTTGCIRHVVTGKTWWHVTRTAQSVDGDPDRAK